jgi:hypothetical protein
MTRITRIVVLAALPALTGCASLLPDRTVRVSMTLAPGQTATGRFTFTAGGRGLVQFFRAPPRQGAAPHPESWTYTGDGGVRLTIGDMTKWGDENQLGYAHSWLSDDFVLRARVRNVSAEPAQFHWAVVGGDAMTEWDVSGAASDFAHATR